MAPSRRRRVLIVSPHFPPINAPDYHRVRLALPHLQCQGWDAEILAVSAHGVEGVHDPDLARSLPSKTKVHRVKAWPWRVTRLLGCGGLAWRAYAALQRQGDRLLASGRFDLVFFSTTQFGVLRLARRWRSLFGIPYVLDFQDEWVNSYYAGHPEIPVPGGRLKFCLSQWRARRQEPIVVREAAAIISVSRSYLEALADRQPALRLNHLHTLPFGGTGEDFNHLQRLGIRQRLFDPHDGRQHWVYVGRGGEDLGSSTRAFFCALREAFQLCLLDRDRLRLHFIGTSYAPAKRARSTFLPLACEWGLADIIEEQTTRVPYFEALRCLQDADALMILGSDDEGYTPSKIAPYLLARRPLLAVFRAECGSSPLLSPSEGRTLVTFKAGENVAEIAQRILSGWLKSGAFQVAPPSADQNLESSAEMTHRLCQVFDAAACTR